MTGKIILLVCFLSTVAAVFIKQSGIKGSNIDINSPKGWQTVKTYHPPSSHDYYRYDSYYTYPKYDFEYSVSDKKTGDHKHHRESRDGDRVRGEYSLVEADGSLRKVEYDADDHSGFKAVVSKTLNMHGNDAVSYSGHARHFYPVGHGVKINHYFPGKDYTYHVAEDTDIKTHEKENKLDSEMPAKLEMVSKNEDEAKVSNDTKVSEKEIQPTVKVEMESAPVKEMPSVVAMIMENPSSADVPITDGMVLVPAPAGMAKAILKDADAVSEEPTTKKENSVSDSDLASSYYHPRIYFVRY